LIRVHFILAALLLLLAGCAGCEDPFPTSDELAQIEKLQRPRSLPAVPTNRWADDPKAAALGEKLFGDERLSECGKVSCATCHPSPNFSTNVRLNVGCDGARTTRNAPTLINVGFRRWFYWDGQKDSLWSHAILPLTHPGEMGATGESLRQALQAHHADPYADLFGAPPGAEDPDRVLANFGKAMEAYLRTLVRVHSPFDDQLREFIAAAREDIAAGEDTRVRKLPSYLGLKTYVRTAQCIICHRGPMLSDEEFHNLGVEEVGELDPGRQKGIERALSDRFNGGGAYSDDPAAGRVKLDRIPDDLPKEGPLGAFKTPSLRNVGISAPYMHTGRYPSLEDVVDFYNRGGDPTGTFAGTRAETVVPLELKPEEKQALVELLQSLTAY
jgi:cytochrome c peroxidase